MTSLCEHVWGNSRVEDKVWSHVVGLPPPLADRRLLAVIWQAYFDESERDGSFGFGGYLATAEAWAKFAREWNELLPRFGRINRNGQYYFHMAEVEAKRTQEGIDRTLPFYRVIERHVRCGFFVSLKSDVLNKIVENTIIHHNGLRGTLELSKVSRSCYSFLLLSMLDSMANLMKSEIGPDNKVDLIFDDNSNKGHILSAWDEFSHLRPELAAFFGATPRFEDDTEFLPLQAADLLAYWGHEGRGTAPRKLGLP